MPTDEQLTLLALCRIRDLDWHFLAREAQRGYRRLPLHRRLPLLDGVWPIPVGMPKRLLRFFPGFRGEHGPRDLLY